MLFPELKLLNPDSPGTLSGMTCVQDGASIHKSNENIKFLSDAGFQSRIFSATNKRCPTEVDLHWPARSPDLNPLDFYIWGELKRLVYHPKPNGILWVWQMGLNGALILPQRSLVLSNRNGEGMQVGEEREPFKGEN